MERDLPLLSTHVGGLDEALGGGIPEGSIVLVPRTSLQKAEATKDWIGILVDIVKEAVTADGYKVLALDSLEALYALANFEAPRRGGGPPLPARPGGGRPRVSP